MLSKEASENDIKSAYKKLAPMFHPDKHTNPDSKASAERIFTKVQQAFAILSDPEQRMLYDVYGRAGLKAGTELAQYCTTREEILAECKARERLKKEMVKHAMADANSFMEVNVDIRNLISNPSEDNNIYGNSRKDGLISIPEMGLQQSVQTQISRMDTILWGGYLMVNEGKGGGYASGTLRHVFSPYLSGDIALRLGSTSRPLTVSATKQLAKDFQVTGGLSFGEDGSADFDCAFIRRLANSCTGLLQLHTGQGQNESVRTGIQWVGEKSSASAFIQAGSDPHLALKALTYVTDDIKVKIGAKLAVINSSISYGAERDIQGEDNRIAGTIQMDALGVHVRLKYTCMSQRYVVPIHIADEAAAEIVLLGTAIPLLGYFALKRFIIDPYLQREEQREKVEKRRKNRRHLERARQEAKAAVMLMTETVGRKIAAEEAVNGLVIVQALYGQVITSMGANNVDVDDFDLPLVTDVTVPLQCLVDHSQLRLPASSKAGLLGFYDPCPDEPKSLRVRYRAMGNMHEVTVNDDEELVCPKKAHVVRIAQH